MLAIPTQTSVHPSPAPVPSLDAPAGTAPATAIDVLQRSGSEATQASLSSAFVIGGSVSSSEPAAQRPPLVTSFDGPRQFANWDQLTPLERQFLKNQHDTMGGWDGIQRAATRGMLGDTNHAFWNDPGIRAAFDSGNLVAYQARLGALRKNAARAGQQSTGASTSSSPASDAGFVIGGSVNASGPTTPPEPKIEAFDGPREFSNWSALTPLEQQFLRYQHDACGGWDRIQRTATRGFLGDVDHPYWNDPIIKAAFESGNIFAYRDRLAALRKGAR